METDDREMELIRKINKFQLELNRVRNEKYGKWYAEVVGKCFRRSVGRGFDYVQVEGAEADGPKCFRFSVHYDGEERQCRIARDAIVQNLTAPGMWQEVDKSVFEAIWDEFLYDLRESTPHWLLGGWERCLS